MKKKPSCPSEGLKYIAISVMGASFGAEC